MEVRSKEEGLTEHQIGLDDGKTTSPQEEMSMLLQSYIDS